MSTPLFNLIYRLFAMFYVAKMITLWVIFFYPELTTQGGEMIIMLTIILLLAINKDYFEIFTDYIHSKGGRGFNIVIFSWVVLSGVVTLYGFERILYFSIVR